jgi:hypothetical protein
VLLYLLVSVFCDCFNLYYCLQMKSAHNQKTMCTLAWKVNEVIFNVSSVAAVICLSTYKLNSLAGYLIQI